MRNPTCAVVISLIMVGSSACNSSPTAPSPPYAPFSVTDLEAGEGREAVVGSRATLHYAGWLYQLNVPENKGRLFDTSVGGPPFSFVLGANQVIPGFEQGVRGMRVGGVRRMIVPPELAYGPQGAGGGLIPPDSTIVFEVELLDVQDVE